MGAGFHILNDAVYKSLLFMNAGSILYSTGTRNLNKVGGLSGIMPIVAVTAFVGVFSLSGLPPTNGFASKWLIYQATVAGGLQFAPFVAGAILAFFVGMCTLAYSLKFYNSAFSGKPGVRETDAPGMPKTMIFPQVVLALVCVGIGLSPFWAMELIGSIFGSRLSEVVHVGAAGGLTTIPVGGALAAAWNPIMLVIALIVCIVVAEMIRNAGRPETRTVPSWYGGEEQVDDEVRYRAKGLYAPFNQVFAGIYPRVPLPRLPSLKRLRPVFDLDSWLLDPLLRAAGKTVDTISRSHVGTPQLYMIWQIAGMVVVLTVLFLVIR